MCPFAQAIDPGRELGYVCTPSITSPKRARVLPSHRMSWTCPPGAAARTAARAGAGDPDQSVSQLGLDGTVYRFVVMGIGTRRTTEDDTIKINDLPGRVAQFLSRCKSLGRGRSRQEIRYHDWNAGVCERFVPGLCRLAKKVEYGGSHVLGHH